MLSDLISTNPVQALGSSLLHSLWQIALVALAFALISPSIKRAQTRYLLACGALLLCLTLPVYSFTTHYEIDRAVQPQIQPQTVSNVSAQTDASAQPVEPDDLEPSNPQPSPQISVSPTKRPSSFNPAPLLPYLALFWLLGVMLLSLRLALQLLHIEHFKRRSKVARATLQTRVAQLAKRLELRRKIRVLESSSDSPAVVGILKPVLFVPVSAITGLSSQQLDAILLHELVHIRRHDYLVNLLQSLIETLLFYHPAVWWLSAVIRTERENACDDEVVSLTGDKLEYARALVALEDNRQPALVLAAGDGDLSSRVKRLHGLRVRRGGSSWLVGLFVLVSLSVGLLLGVNEAKAQNSEGILPDREIWITMTPGVRLDADKNFTEISRVNEGRFIIVEERSGGKVERWLMVARQNLETNYTYLEGSVAVEANLSSGDLEAMFSTADIMRTGNFPELPEDIASWLEQTLKDSLGQMQEVFDSGINNSTQLYSTSIPIYSADSRTSPPAGSFSLFTDVGASWVQDGSHDYLFNITEEDRAELNDSVIWTEPKFRYLLLEAVDSAISQAEHLRSYNLVTDAEVVASFENILELLPELKPELERSSSIIEDDALRSEFLNLLAAAPSVAKPPAPDAEERRELIEEGDRLEGGSGETQEVTKTLWATRSPDVAFSEDYSDIKAITSPSGFFILEERDEETGLSKVAILRQARGFDADTISYSYLVNGEKRHFDSKARAWFKEGLELAVLQGFREHLLSEAQDSYHIGSSGIEANGVFRSHIDTQTTFDLEFEIKMLKTSPEDSVVSLRSAQHHAAHNLNSHAEIAEYISQVFGVVEPTPELLFTALKPIQELSDEHRAQVMQELIRFYKDDELKEAFRQVVMTIENETLRDEVLQTL